MGLVVILGFLALTTLLPTTCRMEKELVYEYMEGQKSRRDKGLEIKRG